MPSRSRENNARHGFITVSHRRPLSFISLSPVSFLLWQTAHLHCSAWYIFKLLSGTFHFTFSWLHYTVYQEVYHSMVHILQCPANKMIATGSSFDWVVEEGFHRFSFLLAYLVKRYEVQGGFFSWVLGETYLFLNLIFLISPYNQYNQQKIRVMDGGLMTIIVCIIIYITGNNWRS